MDRGQDPRTCANGDDNARNARHAIVDVFYTRHLLLLVESYFFRILVVEKVYLTGTNNEKESRVAPSEKAIPPWC